MMTHKCMVFLMELRHLDLANGRDVSELMTQIHWKLDVVSSIIKVQLMLRLLMGSTFTVTVLVKQRSAGSPEGV